MDPNVCLQNILVLAEAVIQDYEDPGSNGVHQDDAANLAAAIQDLHNWISNGGFLPEAWQPKP